MDSIRSRCRELLKAKFLRLLFVCAVSVMLVFLLTGAAFTKYLVVIEDNENKTLVYTSENQPQLILEQQKITLGKYDSFSLSEFEDGKATLTIHRAREIMISADEKQSIVYLTHGTAQDALNQADVAVADDDLINVSLTEPVVDKMNIQINRVVYQTTTTQTPIPFEIEKIPTPTLKKGRTSILQQGKNGTLETVTMKTLIDGDVVDSVDVSEQVVKKPIPTKLFVGDPKAHVSKRVPNQPIELDANGNPLNYKSKVVGKATAYSSLGRPTSFKPGDVAMNLSKFPKGTRLYIKTPDGSFIYGYSVVKDTGIAVNDGRVLVDLFFSSYKESCLFGAKNVEIYIL